jgi:DNA-nicking Smr family endonuclease
MGTRPLSSDEAALWARVMAGVRPLRAVAPKPAPVAPLAAKSAIAAGRPLPAASAERVGIAASAKRPHQPLASTGVRKSTPPPPRAPSNTLDGTWDRQLARGLVSPDRTIDLHGHTLHSAYDLLDAAVAAAIRAGDRTILLVTGKPPRPASERPHAPNSFRGAIRAATGDWLAGSRHAAAIAAVRAAHPRHGGAGALYIVLKRPKISQKS